MICKKSLLLRGVCAFAVGSSLFSASAIAAPTALFSETRNQANAERAAHVKAAKRVVLNRRALNSPEIELDLFGEKVIATRDRVERHKAGVTTWIGHAGGNRDDVVIITSKGSAFSGRIDYKGSSYQITGSRQGGTVLNEIDFAGYPQEEPLAAPDAGPQGGFVPGDSVSAEGDVIVQDLLIAYTDDACVAVGGDGVSQCDQIEADITAAVVDMNQSYGASGIDITMNLAGFLLVDYVEKTNDISGMLNELRLTNDGNLDQVHAERDAVGADLVGLVTASGGGFCGIGYRPASPTSAFNVTAEFCLTNRTLAHELGHNQGSLHDRAQHSGGTSGAYNYGYRRCSDGSADDVGSPYFRTTMAYSCAGAGRVARFSNPTLNYLGVPSGIDPLVDPNEGAWAARTLNESAAYVASFRDAPASQTIPAAPSALGASAAGPDVINVSWADNANNEQSFVLQRSLDGSAWSTRATLGANTTSFTDNGLNPDTTYFYRVRADNSAGASAYSNSGSATTQSVPSEIVDVATGETPSAGSVSGNFTATQADGGTIQTITEVSSGGPKRNRRQSLTHTWNFDVFGGAGGSIVTANAWVSGAEGMNFSYSLDGGASWNLMFTVDETSSATVKTFALPGNAAGDVRIQVRDSAQQSGEPADTVNVDALFITSYTDAGSPPAAPSNMSVTGTTASSVSLSFTDNASDEFGFEIWRSASDPGSNCNAGAVIDGIGARAGTGSVSYSDLNAAPDSTYWYWAKAFNGAGDQGCSNAASGTTLAAPAISGSANGYKVKGTQTVDLSWSGATTGQVDILRNGSVIITTNNDGAYTDNIGIKGGGSYTYAICEAGSSTVCTSNLNVVF